MKLKVIKLYPARNSRFHFGDGDLFSTDLVFHSDSLFSTLVVNYIRKHGEEKVRDFIDTFPVISSLFLGFEYNGREHYFIPRPLHNESEMWQFTKHGSEEENPQKLEKLRKSNKKNKFISLELFNEVCKQNTYLVELVREGKVGFSDEKNFTFAFLLTENVDENRNIRHILKNLVKKSLTEHIQVSRAFGSAEEGLLFELESFSVLHTKEVRPFFYFLVDSSERVSKDFRSAVEMITDFGIGGKQSVGCGKIESVELESEITIEEPNEVKGYMSLSLVLPAASDIDTIKKESYYQIIERGGYIGYTGVMRKKVRMLAEGSFFRTKLSGRVENVGRDNLRSTKFGKPLLLPIPA